MDIEQYCQLFQISNDGVDIDKITSENIKNQLLSKKFVLIQDAVEKDYVNQMREFWLSNPISSSNHSDLCYGQENYAHVFFGKYKRYFDFYWNEPTCKLSRQISLLLHYARNIIGGYHPLYGLTFMPNRIGIYQAVTHYPIDTGEMAVHVDPNSFLPLHYVLPLTFKSKDWQFGGLNIHLGSQIIDIDELHSLGSLLIFNPSIPHSVQRVGGIGSDSSIGRLQLFSIPTEFSQKKAQSFYKNTALEIFGRYKYMLYQKGFGLRDSNKNFR
jgi:hypothetical protein